ncbi:MAG: BatD family protein [Muribaculaceae bacterium]|nr:BatD family protein [Muribaculaceae bacterium]
MLRKLIFTLAVLAISVVANAADVSFSVDYPRQVVQGNKFQISFSLRNAEGNGFKAPEVGGCKLLYGPSKSSSYSSQWVNGVSSSSSSEEYTMVYRADQAGKYTVGSATVSVGGKQYSTKPFTIEILPPDRSAQQGNNRGSQSVQIDNANTQTAGKQVSSKDLFVRIILSKSNVYEQEAVVCTIKLYTKYQISQFIANIQPSYNGFLIEELPVSPNLNEIEHVNGENYMVAELKKCILFPQQSGKLTITSGTYDVTVVQYEQFRTPFGIMRQPVEKQLQVKSNTSSVNILPLPEPKPASFNGAVGNFTVSTEIKPQVLKTFEAATYSYIIRGSGNIKYLKSPTIGFPSQFDVYDPQNNINAKPSGSTVSGTVTIDYTFIPQFVGKYEIPGTEFTYFNPATRKYETLTTQKYDLTVAKGSGSASQAPKGGIEQKNRDILHIKTGDLHLKQEHSYAVEGFGYWLWYIIPLLLLAAVLFYYRKALKARSDMQLMRTKRANKVAQKRLRAAKQWMRAGDKNKFYAEVLTALWGYLSDKIQIPVSELNKENISAELTNYGATDEVIAAVIEVLNNCEFAQYAPELSGNDMESIYSAAADAMDKLENTKRKKA